MTVTGWLVCFVVVGPVVEELCLRGVLLHRLPTTRPAVAGAVLANLVAFVVRAVGAVHR
ncbi:CPBP family glutamic-type intramembrane protease [Micromonospora humida]|uniref:CPBP family intramembrane metalloprotease n=1 Tax=Micromonospora humida TaxID=2809018 RepID=A0ABS2IPQ9_9ACTN|nr:CPBP family glutamic-type intramembrane protease [Micromonospora humida]MBM7075256.1 CPBP family intramembrane metalloprotease [Micromonospora humida]